MYSWTREHANNTEWLDVQLRKVYPLVSKMIYLLLVFSDTTSYYD